MKTKSKNISVVVQNEHQHVIPHLDDLKKGADSSKEELGFLPRSAYDELASSGSIFLAKILSGQKYIYVGHVIYGGVYPNAKIVQLYVKPDHRGYGVASLLIETLKAYLTDRQWLSIQANVAENLPANSVWEHHGFRLARVKPGGKSRNRNINVRVFQLHTKSLLDFMQSGAEKEIRLTERLSTRPIYLMDLNIFFDNLKNRPGRLWAGKLISEGMKNNIRLMISEEFIEELKRTSYDKENDAVLSFAKNLTIIKLPPKEFTEEIIKSISNVIFNKKRNNLTQRDISDLTHLSTAIYQKTAGFITGEKAILRARDVIQEKYKIDVVGAEEFCQILSSDLHEVQKMETNIDSQEILFIRNDSSYFEEIEKFLNIYNTPLSHIRELREVDQANRIFAKIGTEIVAYAKWHTHSGLKKTTDIFICANEEVRSAEAIIDHILNTISYESSENGPSLLKLKGLSGQNITRQIAISMGFSDPIGVQDTEGKLQKISVGKIVSKENWLSFRREINSVASINLPKIFPKFLSPEQQIKIGIESNTISMTIRDIERVISPVIIMLDGRDGVIVPIRREFSEILFGPGRQLSVFNRETVILRRTRVYFNSARSIGKMKVGLPILFYESGSQQHAFAIGRIIDSRIVSKSEALKTSKDHGALDERTILTRSATEMVTEALFDNIFTFSKPVSLKKLREIGCVDKSNMIAARRIPFEQLMQVIKEGT